MFFFRLAVLIKFILIKKQVYLNSLKRYFCFFSLQKELIFILGRRLQLFFLYSHLGSNVFLQPYFSRDSHVIDDDSFDRTYEISDNVDALHGVEFNRNMNISIKELQLYTFKKEEPFKKISNNIFSLVNYIRSKTRHRYNLKVMRINSYYWKMIGLFINKDRTKVSLSDNCSYCSINLRFIISSLQDFTIYLQHITKI